MALDKNGKKLPKGIYYHKQSNNYLGRFMYQGEKYEVYDKNLQVCIRLTEDKQYEVRHGLAAKNESITVDAWHTTWIKEYCYSAFYIPQIFIFSSKLKEGTE